MELKGVWKDMRGIYLKMGLSEEEIAERMLCKITRCIEQKNKLDECDKK
jgi:predicted AAA+ superfamily ATPase